MNYLVALRAPGPPAGHECDVAVEALAAHRAGGRLDRQSLRLDSLFDSSPAHRVAQYRQAGFNLRGAIP